MTDAASRARSEERKSGRSPVVRQSLEGVREKAIGRHGLSDHLLNRYLDRLIPELAKLKNNFKTKRLPLLRLPQQTADIDAASDALKSLSRGASVIVFLGTGGSSLGGQTLAQTAGWNIPGSADPEQKNRPRIRFYDNLDPHTLQGALSQMDLANTRFVVTSKSGGTAETLAQAISALSAVNAAGLRERIPDLFLGLTEPERPSHINGLRALFTSLSIPIIDHPADIGGRFSCLTMVGLLPAMARGLDPLAIRAGAGEVVEALMDAQKPIDFAPALGAAAAVALAKEKGIRTHVIMPYSDRLGRMAHWFVQLWAESLGKNGEGTAPIAALGPVDQHSQLQLFMDGPHEHYLTILRLPTKGMGPTVDQEFAERAGVAFIGGKAVGDIVDAQAHAVPEALTRAGRPVRTIDLDRLDERTLGATLMHFMLETILAGRMLGIDPFDQPAVELAKEITREKLGNQA